MVSTRKLLQVSPPISLTQPGFHQVLPFYNKYFSNLLLLCSEYCKRECIFKKKQFFLSTQCWLVLILLFCLYENQQIKCASDLQIFSPRYFVAYISLYTSNSSSYKHNGAIFLNTEILLIWFQIFFCRITEETCTFSFK